MRIYGLDDSCIGIDLSDPSDVTSCLFAIINVFRKSTLKSTDQVNATLHSTPEYRVRTAIQHGVLFYNLSALTMIGPSRTGQRQKIAHADSPGEWISQPFARSCAPLAISPVIVYLCLSLCISYVTGPPRALYITCTAARHRRIKGSRTAIIIVLDIDWGSFDDEDGYMDSFRAYSGAYVYASSLCRHDSHCPSASPPPTVGVGSLSVCDWLR